MDLSTVFASYAGKYVSFIGFHLLSWNMVTKSPLRDPPASASCRGSAADRARVKKVVAAAPSLISARPAAKVRDPRDGEPGGDRAAPCGSAEGGVGVAVLAADAATPPLQMKPTWVPHPAQGHRRGHSHLPPCKGSDGALPAPAARSVAAIGAAATTTATASIYDSGPPLAREQASAGGVAVGRSSLTRCSACKAPTLL